MLVHCKEITDKNENKNYLAPPWWKILAPGGQFHNVDWSCPCIHLSVATFSARCTRSKNNNNAQSGYATTREHRVVRLMDGHWVGGQGRTIWRIRFEGWAYCFLAAESRECYSLLILNFTHVSKGGTQQWWPTKITVDVRKDKGIEVLPDGLSSYKLIRRERFGSFWVARWWVRETEAEKEHRFQAIQTSALLVNDSRSVTDNVNIMKI